VQPAAVIQARPIAPSYTRDYRVSISPLLSSVVEPKLFPPVPVLDLNPDPYPDHICTVFK
jgi:hypothetical protein